MDNRELDALVVEHITGGWFTYTNGEYRWLCSAECAEDMKLFPAELSMEIGDSAGLHIPRYATDPAASKQLRDKMREDGWIVLMGGPEAKVPKFWCQVRATYRKNTKGIFHRESDTEELAVALAALAAVGHPVESQE